MASMSYRAVAAAQPGEVTTVPPAIPVRCWPSSATEDAPPPTVTWAGTPAGRLSRNWLTPPASSSGSVPAGRGSLMSRVSEPAMTAIPATLPPRRSTLVSWVPPARSRLQVTAALSTTFTAYPESRRWAGGPPDPGPVRRRDAEQGPAELARADVEDRGPRRDLELGAGQAVPGHRGQVSGRGPAEGEGSAARSHRDGDRG